VARKVQVHLIDDIDGTQADETLSFGLDGVSYEIDLSAKHADRLRTDLEKFLHAARRMGRNQAASLPVRSRRPGQPAKADRAQNQAIREWAKRKGIELSDRGRIPRNIIEQFEAEAGR
jgi:Lsr2